MRILRCTVSAQIEDFCFAPLTASLFSNPRVSAIPGGAQQDLRAVAFLFGRCRSQARTPGVTVGQGGEAAPASAPASAPPRPGARSVPLHTEQSREQSRSCPTQPVLRPASWISSISLRY